MQQTPFQAKSEEKLKRLLMKVKEESGKAGLKLNILKIKIMACGPIISWQMGKKWKQWQILFSQAPESLWTVAAAMKLKDTSPWGKSYDKPRQHIKKQGHHFAFVITLSSLMTEVHYSQSYVFFQQSYMDLRVGP